MFKEIGDDDVIDDIIKSKSRSILWTAVTLLIFKLERRTNAQNVGNWTGYLDVIPISKSSQSFKLSSLCYELSSFGKFWQVRNFRLLFHLYVSCFESKHALLQQMKIYIFDKIYLYLFGDIFVFIAASALNVVVVVIEMKNDKLTKTEIKSQESDCNSKRMYVFKTGEHYDAIVPETRPISGNDRINVALAANDKDKVKSFQNPLGFYAAEMEFKSSDNDVLNNSPVFCNFIDIGM